jgi:hypothetical protein
MARKGPQIPRDLIPDGVPLCIARAKELIEAAQASSQFSAIAAANLFVLGIQEVGKAGLLVDASLTGLPMPTITPFYEHWEKTRRGIALLGERVAWLRTGAFQAGAFQADAFDVGTPMSEGTRLDLLYVDFEDSWLAPPEIDPALLDTSMSHALDSLRTVEQELLDSIASTSSGPSPPSG